MQSQAQEKKSEHSLKHVVISGGSKGLGLYLSQFLLKHGYKISSFSRRKTEEVEILSKAHGDDYYFLEADGSKSADIDSFCRNAIEKLGNIYGVINNAAVAVEGVLATLPEIEIEKMLAINLGGALSLTRLCLRNMLLSKEGGRIISISSIAGSRGYTGLVVYSATKAALEGMTRSLARELGSRQITVNTIAPGYMLTDLSRSLNEEQRQTIIRRTPLGRLTEFEDVMPVVELLLSEKGKFITGQTIAVDGGLSI